MNLKGLVHRELGEGLTEEELASAVGVSVRTITNILVAKLPQDPVILEQFARYFRMDADFCEPVVLHTQGQCSSSQGVRILPLPATFGRFPC